MSLARAQEGSTLVEFALVASGLILFLVGIVDYALEIQQAIQVSEAAGAGAAYGVIPGNVKNLAGMQNAAKAAAAGVNGFTATASNLFTCTPGGPPVGSGAVCPGYGTPIEYVVVQTSATVPMPLAYVGMPGSLSLHGTASYRVPWTP